jgi:hypothetical protein
MTDTATPIAAANWKPTSTAPRSMPGSADSDAPVSASAPPCAPGATGCGRRCWLAARRPCPAGAARCRVRHRALSRGGRAARRQMSSRSTCRPYRLRGRRHARAMRMGVSMHVVAMDSLIHYRAEDVVTACGALAGARRTGSCSRFAPRTPLLATMHAAGKTVPARRPRAGDRARRRAHGRRLERDARLDGWQLRDRTAPASPVVSIFPRRWR